MSFSDWKKRSKVFNDAMSGFCNIDKQTLVQAVQAAYKAGERDGQKNAEDCTKSVIELRALLDARNNI